MSWWSISWWHMNSLLKIKRISRHKMFSWYLGWKQEYRKWSRSWRCRFNRTRSWTRCSGFYLNRIKKSKIRYRTTKRSMKKVRRCNPHRLWWSSDSSQSRPTGRSTWGLVRTREEGLVYHTKHRWAWEEAHRQGNRLCKTVCIRAIGSITRRFKKNLLTYLRSSRAQSLIRVYRPVDA